MFIIIDLYNNILKYLLKNLKKKPRYQHNSYILFIDTFGTTALNTASSYVEIKFLRNDINNIYFCTSVIYKNKEKEKRFDNINVFRDHRE